MKIKIHFCSFYFLVHKIQKLKIFFKTDILKRKKGSVNYFYTQSYVRPSQYVI